MLSVYEASKSMPDSLILASFSEKGLFLGFVMCKRKVSMTLGFLQKKVKKPESVTYIITVRIFFC